MFFSKIKYQEHKITQWLRKFYTESRRFNLKTIQCVNYSKIENASIKLANGK